MLFIPAAILSAVTALFAAAALGMKGRSAYLLAVYLFAVSSVVLSFELLGLPRLLNNRLVFLGLQTIFALLSVFIWRRRGKPNLLGPFSPDLRRLDFSRLGPSVRRHPALWLFAFAVDLAYAVNAYLIFVVPPNNNDSLYQHMARVVHWLHNGTYLPYSTTFTWQLYYPFNAQALIYWTVLFWGSDQLAGFIQFSAALVTILSVYAFARMLRFNRPQSVFAALLWASFPQVLFQSTTTQNDLVPAAMMAAGVYFLVYALFTEQSVSAYFLSAVGISLALGAKQTAFFILPGLAVACLVIAWKNRPASLRNLLRWLPLAALVFGLLGAFVYVENYVVYHNPMGDPQTLHDVIKLPLVDQSSASLENPASTESAPRALWINLNRIVYQFFDTTGLPPLIEGYLFRGKAHLAQVLYKWLDLPLESAIAANPNSSIAFDFFRRPPLQEDETWFGIFAPVFLVYAAFSQLFHSFRRVDPLAVALWLLAISFVLLELLLRPGWDAYLGRNFILALVFVVPFSAAVYRPGWIWQAVVWLVVILSVYSLVTLTLNNTAKPLIGQKAIWALSRADKLTLQNYQLKEPAELVEKNVPEDAVLALPSGVWEYPFYDLHLHRVLVSPFSDDLFNDPAWIRQQHIQYLLVKRSSPPAKIGLPLQGIAAGEEWSLFLVAP